MARSEWRAWRQAWVKKWFPVNAEPLPAPVDFAPLTWAASIIDAWSRTGNIGKIFRLAEERARQDGDYDTIRLIHAMRDQISDWYGQMR